MRRHAIVTRLGNRDRARVLVASDTDVQTKVPFFCDNRPASKRLVHKPMLQQFQRLGLQPPEIAMDLIVLAATVFAADLRISRSMDSQDGWTREIDLYVPVSDVPRWNTQRQVLSQALTFLTGDVWRLYFRARPRGMETLSRPLDKNSETLKATDTACLFSGGLDSFIGAIDFLESGKQPILVGHHKSPDVAKAQGECVSFLRSSYPDRPPEFADMYLEVPKGLFRDAEEKTERGRSFLFFALGAGVASALGRESHLIVPENGLISLNVPLTHLRLGALSTKTTHPYFMESYQRLLTNLGLGVRLANPYQCKTKGEMVRDCKSGAILRAGVTRTMSCAHPTARRWLGEPPKHCGTCVPCLIRRAALRFAYDRDPTRYAVSIRSRSLDPTTSEGEQVRALQLAMARLRAHPGAERLLIHESGRLPIDGVALDQLASVYRRGMEEVAALLKHVSTT